MTKQTLHTSTTIQLYLQGGRDGRASLALRGRRVGPNVRGAPPAPAAGGEPRGHRGNNTHQITFMCSAISEPMSTDCIIFAAVGAQMSAQRRSGASR